MVMKNPEFQTLIRGGYNHEENENRWFQRTCELPRSPTSSPIFCTDSRTYHKPSGSVTTHEHTDETQSHDQRTELRKTTRMSLGGGGGNHDFTKFIDFFFLNEDSPLYDHWFSAVGTCEGVELSCCASRSITSGSRRWFAGRALLSMILPELPP